MLSNVISPLGFVWKTVTDQEVQKVNPQIDKTCEMKISVWCVQTTAARVSPLSRSLSCCCVRLCLGAATGTLAGLLQHFLTRACLPHRHSRGLETLSTLGI